MNWIFIPMSSRCLAKISLNSTIVDSKFALSSPTISESSHWNSDRNLVLDSSFFLGSFFSSSASSGSSLRVRRCIGECSDSFPGSLGVGNKNFALLSSGCSTCISA